MGSLEDFQGACAALDRLPIDNWLESVWPGQGLEHQAAESEGVRVKCARPQPPVPPLCQQEPSGALGIVPRASWHQRDPASNSLATMFSAHARKQSQRFAMGIASCSVVLLHGPCERIRVLLFSEVSQDA